MDENNKELQNASQNASQNAKKKPGLKKGMTNNPNGRPAGVPNKVTLDFKQAIVNLLEFAAPQMVDWLGKVSKDDPSKALDLINKLADYAFPKLGRTEHTGQNGGPVQIESDVTQLVLREIPTERLKALIDDASATD